MARTLIAIRHAKSDWGQAMPDEDRPLNTRGERDAPAIGRWLAGRDRPIDLALCSTAKRARQTWRLAAAELDQAPPARYDERVYAAGHRDLMSVLDELADDLGTVAVVGHNPGLSELVAVVAGEPVELKTSAVAVLRWDGTWADVWARRATLVAHATPRGQR